MREACFLLIVNMNLNQELRNGTTRAYMHSLIPYHKYELKSRTREWDR